MYAVMTREEKTRASHAAERNRAEAMREVYEAHAEQIYKFAYFKLGNREDAEDATSQVFVKAATLLDVTQDERSQLAWLYQVARTTVSDFWRRYYKGLTASLEALEEEGSLELVAEPIVLGEADVEEVGCSSGEAERVLALLPENYRRVLELRFLEGRSLKDTAEALGLKEGTARVLQLRALRKAAALAERS